jgi:hypothetical protein
VGGLGVCNTSNNHSTVDDALSNSPYISSKMIKNHLYNLLTKVNNEIARLEEIELISQNPDQVSRSISALLREKNRLINHLLYLKVQPNNPHEKTRNK